MGGSTTGRARHSPILKCKGLPFGASKIAVLDFFSDFNPVDVQFVFDTASGRPSGIAFVVFESADAAALAFGCKNGATMGTRFVKLLQVEPSEMEEQVKYGTAAIPDQNNCFRQLQGLMGPASSSRKHTQHGPRLDQQSKFGGTRQAPGGCDVQGRVVPYADGQPVGLDDVLDSVPGVLHDRENPVLMQHPKHWAGRMLAAQRGRGGRRGRQAPSPRNSSRDLLAELRGGMRSGPQGMGGEFPSPGVDDMLPEPHGAMSTPLELDALMAMCSTAFPAQQQPPPQLQQQQSFLASASSNSPVFNLEPLSSSAVSTGPWPLQQELTMTSRDQLPPDLSPQNWESLLAAVCQATRPEQRAQLQQPVVPTAIGGRCPPATGPVRGAAPVPVMKRNSRSDSAEVPFSLGMNGGCGSDSLGQEQEEAVTTVCSEFASTDTKLLLSLETGVVAMADTFPIRLGGFTLHLPMLPTDTNGKALAAFLSGSMPAEGAAGVHTLLGLDINRKPSGEAFMLFNSKAQAQRFAHVFCTERPGHRPLKAGLL